MGKCTAHSALNCLRQNASWLEGRNGGRERQVCHPKRFIVSTPVRGMPCSTEIRGLFERCSGGDLASRMEKRWGQDTPPGQSQERAGNLKKKKYRNQSRVRFFVSNLKQQLLQSPKMNIFDQFNFPPNN